MSILTELPEALYSGTAFDGFIGKPGFDIKEAEALAWMCQLAYETADRDKILRILNRWGLELVDNGIVVEEVTTVLPLANTHCIVAGGRGATIVAFAGTDPLVLANWITNFDIHINSTDAAEGFETAAAAVWPKLEALVAGSTINNPHVIVIGHSLGGALATLTARHMETDLRGTVRVVYTFGMPRPADAQFAVGYMGMLGDRTYRLVCGDDVVPTVPPSVLGFRHVGRYLHCDHGDKFDARDLAADSTSDEPQFVKGVSQQLRDFADSPFSTVAGALARVKLAAGTALGFGAMGARTDPVGISIELLPALLRDHIPDRYIAALS
jgi:hypothetical protein